MVGLPSPMPYQFLQFFFRRHLYNNREVIELVSAVFHVQSYALSCLNKLAADILGVLSHRVSRKQNIFFSTLFVSVCQCPFWKNCEGTTETNKTEQNKLNLRITDPWPKTAYFQRGMCDQRLNGLFAEKTTSSVSLPYLGFMIDALPFTVLPLLSDFAQMNYYSLEWRCCISSFK